MKNDIYAGIGSDAVEAKTGRTWAEWIAALDKAGAADWPHKRIAEHVHDEFGCPGWWSQMVTVGYEQAKGLRVKHQTTSGYNANASKTIGVPVAKLYKAWSDPKMRDKWLVGAKKMVVRKATPNKSLRKRLKPLIRKAQPYTKRIAHKGIWIEPELLVEIEYRAKSAEGKVRHPFFKGIRERLMRTHRPKRCHRDWHHIHHGGWRLPCDTISAIRTIGPSLGALLGYRLTGSDHCLNVAGHAPQIDRQS
jgi:hypothetical protein